MNLGEFHLVETIEPNNEIALRIPKGSISDRLNQQLTENAKLIPDIERVIELTGVNNEAAALTAEFYRTGTVRRDRLLTLKNLIYSLDPPIDNVAAMLDAMEAAGKLSEDEGGKAYSSLYRAIYAMGWGACYLINRDGRLTDIADDGQSFMAIVEPLNEDDPPTNNPELLRLATQIQDPHFTWQYSLTWNEGSPIIKTPFEHIQIGEVAVTGEFVPIASSLTL